AFAPAASVADGFTDSASFETRTIASSPRQPEVNRIGLADSRKPLMHLAQFVHRYPPARGGAEAYAERLATYLRDRGDTVDIWTTTAIHLEEFWKASETSPR